MALKRLKWLKYLFVNRTEAETEQQYWNEKRKKHLANEHSEGIAVGLGVTATTPASLSVEVAAGRALDAQGNDPEIESVQEIDLASLVPASGTRTVYITLKHNEVEVEPYFVDEIGDYQNKYVQDSYQLEATTSAPSAPAVELARVKLGAGATSITDAADSKNPQTNEIDLRYRKHSGKEVLSFRDLSDIDEDEAGAFNAMENPSAANPIVTVSKADGIIAPVRDEVVTARGTKPSLDARLDVMLAGDGSFKGITKITPAAPLTGGGIAGDVPLGIANATPLADGAMSAADKSKLDGMEAGATGDLTAAEVLSLLKTVDGAGSGLDADLLDGFQHRGKAGTAEHPAATATVAGFMSATDKSKLDALASVGSGAVIAANVNYDQLVNIPAGAYNWLLVHLRTRFYVWYYGGSSSVYLQWNNADYGGYLPAFAWCSVTGGSGHGYNRQYRFGTSWIIQAADAQAGGNIGMRLAQSGSASLQDAKYDVIGF